MKFLSLFLALFVAGQTFGQGNLNYFNDLVKQHDKSTIEKYLSVWENANPIDGDLQLARFFYLRNRSVGQDEYNPKIKGFGVLEDESLQLALKYLKRGTEHNPSRVDMYLEEVYIYNDLSNFDRAANAYLDFLNASFRMSRPLLKAENKTIEDPNFVILETTKICDFYFDNHLFKSGKEKSIEIATAYNSLYENDDEGLYLLGKLYFQLSEYERSEMYVSKCARRNPQMMKAYFLLGNIHKEIRKYDEAILDFDHIKKNGKKSERKMAKKEIKKLKKAIKEQG